MGVSVVCNIPHTCTYCSTHKLHAGSCLLTLGISVMEVVRDVGILVMEVVRNTGISVMEVVRDMGISVIEVVRDMGISVMEVVRDMGISIMEVVRDMGVSVMEVVRDKETKKQECHSTVYLSQTRRPKSRDAIILLYTFHRQGDQKAGMPSFYCIPFTDKETKKRGCRHSTVYLSQTRRPKSRDAIILLYTFHRQRNQQTGLCHLFTLRKYWRAQSLSLWVRLDGVFWLLFQSGKWKRSPKMEAERYCEKAKV